MKENDFTIEIYRNENELCLIDSLTINGIEFYLFDLGIMKDLDKEHAPPCGCGNRSFIPVTRIEKVLSPLNLSEDDYNEIVTILTEILHIGYCKRCH